MADYIDLPILTTSSGATGGTVSSVGLALPSEVFAVSGSPVTFSGTLTADFEVQDANLVFAGPSSGAADIPSFRQLTVADLPPNSSVATVTALSPLQATTGANPVISIPVAGISQDGFLSSTAWSLFNSKQSSGNFITALTADGTAAGPGSAALTLATVNSSSGAFGSASSAVTITVNGKGLTTASSQVPILIAESQVTNLINDLALKQSTGNYITALTGDVTASGPGSAAATLATVNVTSGTFGSTGSVGIFTVNTKGLLTSSTSIAIQITESQVTNLVNDLAAKQSSGNFITALTGDGTATGPGSVGFNLATVNASSGSFGSASSAVTQTVNGKGLTTASSQVPILIAESQVTNLINDLALKQSTGNYITALTGDVTATGPGSVLTNLAIVNSSSGTFGSTGAVGRFTVNGKGLVTASTSIAIQITESQVTNLVNDLAAKQSSGNYITALTGDGTATGPGSVGFNLSVVNSSSGTFGSASSAVSLTINGKGLTTASSQTPILIAESQVTNLVNDLALKQSTGNYITALTGDGTATGPGSAAFSLQKVGIYATSSVVAATSAVIVATSANTYDTLPMRSYNPNFLASVSSLDVLLGATTGRYIHVKNGALIANNNQTLNWAAKQTFSSDTLTSIDWGDLRSLFDRSQNYSLNWADRILLDSASSTALNWDTRSLLDSTGTQSVDWAARSLKFGNADQNKDLIWDSGGVWVNTLSSTGTSNPTVSLSATSGAGIGASVSSTGWGNFAGLLSINTGTATVANTTACIVNLPGPVRSPTRTKIYLTAANPAAAAVFGTRQIYGVGSTGPSFSILTNSSALGINTLYLWNWMVIGG